MTPKIPTTPTKTPAPTIGRIVVYRTDGRNGLVYDLPAIITCTQETHPGDYADGAHNPLPVPSSPLHVHLTVFSPGGFGTQVNDRAPDDDRAYVGAERITPGSGTYVEWDVEFAPSADDIQPRSWRWPVIK